MVIERARDSLPQLSSDTAAAARWLVESVHQGSPESFLADPQSFLPTLAAVLRDEVLSLDDQRAWFFPVSAMLAAYLRRDFGGEWIVEDNPLVDRFGQPMVAVRLPRGGVAHVDLLMRVSAFLARPRPRDLYADLVSPIQRQLSVNRLEQSQRRPSDTLRSVLRF